MPWAPDYVTAAELAAFMRIDDSVDDVQLALAVTAASRAVDDHTGRQFGQVAAAEARSYTARYSCRRDRWVVRIDDLSNVSAPVPVVSADAGTITLFAFEPFNAAAQSHPYTRLVVDDDSVVQPAGRVGEVSITALWGWAAVPAAVRQAALLQASRLASRRTSPYGVAGSPELGSELRLLARVDPDVAVTLRPYVHPRRGTLVG